MAIAKRHILTVLSFLGFLNIYLMRSNMSVAIVAMVKTPATHLHQSHMHGNLSENYSLIHSTTTAWPSNVTTTLMPFGEGCHDWTPNSNFTANSNGEFDWDRATQGIVLGSFFYGYIFSQLPGGYLATRYGPVRVLGIGVAASGLMTVLTPVAAMVNVYLLIVVRALLGLCEGVYVPATHVVWSRWAPAYERTRIVAIAFSGSHIGIVIANLGSGVLAHYLNWQSIFYVCGGLAFIWSVAWFYLAYDSPADPKAGVSPEELNIILDVKLSKSDAESTEPTCDQGCDSEMSSRRTTASSTASSTAPLQPELDIAELKEKAAVAVAKATKAAASRPSPPWLKFATSPAVWAVGCAHFAHTWFFYTLMTQTSTYLNDELHVSIVKNGFLSAFPFMSFFIGQISAGYFCDWLRKNSRFSTTVIRKSFFGVGAFFAASFLIAVSYVGCNVAAIIPMICLAAVTAGWTVCGFYMNHIDIAPPFAGILMGITNAIATIPGFVSSQIAGHLTKNSATGSPSVVAAEWRNVFAIAAAIQIAGAVVFMIIGSGKQQKWAMLKNKEEEEESEKHTASGKLGQISEEENNSEGSSFQLNDVVVQTNPDGSSKTTSDESTN